MPSYNYECNSCGKEWTEYHGFNETPEKCPFCETNNFKKSYKYTETINKLSSSLEKKPGKKTREFIENARQELKEFKAESRK